MIVVTSVWVVTDADGRDRCGDVNGAGVVTGVGDVIGVVMWPVRGSWQVWMVVTSVGVVTSVDGCDRCGGRD